MICIQFSGNRLFTQKITTSKGRTCTLLLPLRLTVLLVGGVFLEVFHVKHKNRIYACIMAFYLLLTVIFWIFLFFQMLH